MSTPLTDATALLAKLVSFDTTSAKTNIPCAEFIRDYLAGHGVARLFYPPTTASTPTFSDHRPARRWWHRAILP